MIEQSSQPIADTRAHHGEGAIWDAMQSRWLWVDMLAGRVMVTTIDGSTAAMQSPDAIAALIRPHVQGGYIVVGERTIWWTDLNTTPQWKALAELPIEQDCRANEGACDSDGSLTVGSMSYDESSKTGNVWTFRSDGSLALVLSGTTISNGTVFEPDNTVLFTDSATGQVRRYDVAAAWLNPRTVVSISTPGTAPDGICMDREGGIWVAVWGGGCAQRWSANGVLTDSVTVPTPHVTSVALGGADGRTLFITTSAVDRPDSDTAAGMCFQAQVATPGAPILACRIPSLLP